MQNFFNTLKLLFLTFLILHIASCIFIILGNLDYYEETWIKYYHLENSSNVQIYIKSVFYCLTVLTTVGYGNYVSRNTIERCFTLIWMLFGIAFYSFTIGFITNFFT